MYFSEGDLSRLFREQKDTKARRRRNACQVFGDLFIQNRRRIAENTGESWTYEVVVFLFSVAFSFNMKHTIIQHQKSISGCFSSLDQSRICRSLLSSRLPRLMRERRRDLLGYRYQHEAVHAANIQPFPAGTSQAQYDSKQHALVPCCAVINLGCLFLPLPPARNFAGMKRGLPIVAVFPPAPSHAVLSKSGDFMTF